jgi:hypothetical protein
MENGYQGTRISGKRGDGLKILKFSGQEGELGGRGKWIAAPKYKIYPTINTSERVEDVNMGEARLRSASAFVPIRMDYGGQVGG